MLFGVISDSYDRKITKKFNYTTLFMRHYLYSSKLNNKAISLQEFTGRNSKINAVLRVIAEHWQNGNYHASSVWFLI